MLKQGPLGRPLVKCAIVVTPASITQNWAAEASPQTLETLRMKPHEPLQSAGASSLVPHTFRIEPRQIYGDFVDPWRMSLRLSYEADQ